MADASSNDPNDNWFWGIVDNADNGAIRDGLGLAWRPFINGYEFQLTGVRVPEASALALLALGFIALVLLNHRRTPST